MKERVYISGPMTGIPEFNFPAFFNKEKELKKSGWKVINPARIGKRIILKRNVEYQDYIKADLKGLFKCSTIYMMKGWQNSKGANLEKHVAEILLLKIIYEDETKL